MRLGLLLALAVILPGCAASQGATPKETTAVGTASLEGVSDTAGAIDGIVVDEAQAPLEGVTVGIASVKLDVSTDASGKFHFGNLPAGNYEVGAIKLGYESAAKKLDVQAGQSTNAILTLKILAVKVPYSMTFGPWSGFFSCMISAGAITACTGDRITNVDVNDIVFPGDHRMLFFNLTADEWKTMIGESRWNQGSIGTGTGMAIYPSYQKRAGSHWWCEATGKSPLLFRYESVDPDTKAGLSKCTSQGTITPVPSPQINPLALIADPGFGGTSADNPPLRVMLQQKYEALMTVFYMDGAPAGYSGFGDQ